MGKVRKPRVDVSRVGRAATHGRHIPRRFIIHSTESSDRPGTSDISAIFDFWISQARGYNAHVIIDKDGNSGQGAYGAYVVWATAGANTGSLQFELVGRAAFTKEQWMARQPQLHKLARWIAFWSKAFGIPIDREHVRLHKDYPAGGHWDPGPGFPVHYVIGLAREYKRKGW